MGSPVNIAGINHQWLLLAMALVALLVVGLISPQAAEPAVTPSVILIEEEVPPIVNSINPKEHNSATPPKPSKPSLSERPVIIPLEMKPERPNLPERPGPPRGGDVVVPSSDLRALIDDFQKSRENFLAQQRVWREQINEASAEERQMLRQRIKENLQIWLEEQKSHIQSIREQAKEIKNNLPSMRDVIDQAKEERGGR